MLVDFDLFRGFERTGVRRAFMPIDAYRRGDEFLLHVDLPGIDPETIDLVVDRNVLTIEAERSWKPADGDKVVTAERPRGHFTRRLVLGDALDASRISAQYDRGVLTVTVPVAEEAKPRKVTISVGQAPQDGTVEPGSTEPASQAA
jgi:HSP20 family protein